MGMTRIMISILVSLVWVAAASALDVKLQWDPNTESDLAGYKVYYGVDGLASPDHLDVSNQTIATISGLDPGHNYSFAITAYNTEGLESPYSNVVTALESILPVVSITNPSNNAKVSNTVSIAASASDNVGVVKVEYYVNGTLKATDTAEPYLYSWDTLAVTPGTYSITAKAYDAAGNVGLSTVSLNVVNDVTPPTISYTAPLQGSSVSGSVTVSCNTSDDVGVTRVEFFVNGTMRAAINTVPYNFAWNTIAETNGSYTLTAKAYDAAGNVGQSAAVTITVNNPVPDTTAPIVTAFTIPATATTLTVAISSFTASDSVGVTGYLVTESAAAPSAVAAGWFASAPTSFTFSSAGVKSVYAWAKDAAGNVSTSRSAAVTITLPDTTLPTINSFTMPATATTLSVPVSSITASDNVAVKGYIITESSAAPAATATSWSATAPVSFTFAGSGARTAYAWAKDASGNVSAAVSANVTITLPDVTAPSVAITTPTSGATASGTLTINVSASDNIGVTKVELYLNATLLATDTVTPYNFSWNTAGYANASYNLTAKAYDAAGNVGQSATVSVVVPDTTAPIVSAFSMPATATTLTVPVSSFTASDNVAVTGYMITESATTPTATATGWTTAAPGSFNFAGTGVRTAYAWTKDGAGNVSAAVSAKVTITLPDVTAPAISITSPAGGITVSGTATVTASATNNIRVTKVEFYVNGALSATSTTAPHSFNWDTTTFANGTYTLTAVAYDNTGKAVQSTPVTAVVNNSVISTTVKGDVDGDGAVTIADALLVLRAVTNPILQTETFKASADVAPLDTAGKPMGDGVINLSDALLILRKAVGLLQW